MIYALSRREKVGIKRKNNFPLSLLNRKVRFSVFRHRCQSAEVLEIHIKPKSLFPLFYLPLPPPPKTLQFSCCIFLSANANQASRQEDRTESVTSLLFFHFFRTTTPLTQETRPRWWIKRRFRAASEGRPEWDRGPCWGLGGGSPSPRARWGPKGPRRAQLPRQERILALSAQPYEETTPVSSGSPAGRRGGPGGAGKRRGESGPSPREGPAQRLAGPRGVGPDNTPRPGGPGPPSSPPPPQPPRPSRECKPRRLPTGPLAPALARSPAPPGQLENALPVAPLTAAGRHLELRATTWAACGRARAPEPDVSGPRPARAPETPSFAVPAPAPPQRHV